MPNQRNARKWTPATATVFLRRTWVIWSVLSVIGLGLPSTVRGEDRVVAADTSWEPLSTDERVARLQSALDQAGIDSNTIQLTLEQFEEDLGSLSRDPLDAFVAAIAEIAESVQTLAELTRRDPLAAASSIDPSEANYAALESLPKVVRMSLRTWMGRELVRSRFYDEALPVLAEVDALESIDAASTFFYRGVCYHALLMKTEALRDLRALLENEDECPTRFSRVAKLMVADIKPLKEDSLDEISRLMTDVSRRLDLGRSNERVEEQEQKIIDKLTKLIDKLEEQQQQQQQQQQQGGSGGSGNPSGQDTPMDDSRVAGANGQGNVEKKDLDEDPGWGNLPPAERKETLQRISRDLPTHYRDAIEAYFRKQATDK